MILIDTDVFSELWKPAPDLHVLAWTDAQVVETLYVSVVTIAELRFGIAMMPTGKRRTVYEMRLEQKVLPVFTDRVLPFDLETSQAYGTLMATAIAVGHTISTADGYIVI